MAGSAQGAVDSLLGRLSSVLLEEAKLLRGVRGDVEFIKDEMMNMNGFLLDLADVEHCNNQVDAWARQVKEVAYDSQNCIDRYMQCVGAGVPGGGGLLATARRAPHLLRTMFARHRVAMRIKELKARARDLGERRLRYNVSIPAMPTARTPATTAAAAAAAAEVDARRRALANATDFLNDDIREVIGWLTQKLPHDHPQRRLRCVAVVRRQYQEDEYPLARKVFEHPSISSSFPFKAWINVDRLPFHGLDQRQESLTKSAYDKYTKRQRTLKSILEQLFGVDVGDHHHHHTAVFEEDMDEMKMVEKLRDHLKGKRFLIVAANDPNGSVQKEIEAAFQAADGANLFPSEGSAIMVTTWQPPRESSSSPASAYRVKNYLDIETLFYNKAVALLDGRCDSDLKETLRRIIIYDERNSKTVMPDEPNSKIIIMRRGWNFFSMEMFLRALYVNPNRARAELQILLQSLTPPKITTQIIRYCYDDLPSHYKSCLLYLSILFERMSEDSTSTKHSRVRRTSIVRRWAAENLITRRDDRAAVDEAERCFDDLVLRGLVSPVDTGAAGKVKSCKVHHRVLSFITKMARDEGLVDDEVDTDLPPDLACRLSIRNGIRQQQLQLPSSSKKKKKNPIIRVVSQKCTTACWNWKPPAPMMDSEGESNKRAAQDDNTRVFLESLPSSSPLELVQVLDLEGFKWLRRHHLKDVCNKMSRLKYLSIRNTNVSILPKDIERLKYLETLDIRQTRIRTFTTKGAIALPKLVHLLAGHVEHQGIAVGRSFFTVDMPRGIASMADLQILCHVVVSNSADELMEVGRLQQLRKLGLVLRGKEVRLSHFLRVIERLNECLRSLSVKIELTNSDIPDLNMGKMAFSPPKSLESLNINGNITGLPSWIKDLGRLVKITLCGTSLTSSAIRMLGELTSLRCLRLRHQSYIEMRLTFEDGEFPNLRYLVVEGSDITKTHFGNGAAPKLEKIVWAFTEMMSLTGIKYLPCLKEVELNGDCDPYPIIHDLAEHPKHPVVIHNA